jgi:hypothetical protein
MSDAKPRRLGLIIPWTLFALASVAWTAFWFVAKDQAIKRLDAVIVSAKARGVDASYETVRASGYPLHLKLNLTNARVTTAALPQLDAALLPVAINLVDPSHLIIDLKDGLRWTGRDGVTHTLDPVRGAMSVHWKDGALTRVSFDLEGAPTKKLLAHGRPDPRTSNAWQVAVDVEGAEDGDALRAGVVIDHTAALLRDVNPADPLGGWISSGGRATVEALDMRWQGATMTGTGAFGLDAQRRPAGAVTLKAEGQSAAILALLGALDAGAENTATLTAKDGVWRLGQATHPAKPLYDLSSPP